MLILFCLVLSYKKKALVFNIPIYSEKMERHLLFANLLEIFHTLIRVFMKTTIKFYINLMSNIFLQ